MTPHPAVHLTSAPPPTPPSPPPPSDPLPGQEKEHAMTRPRKQKGNGKGTVVFVGAGPRDPGLLPVPAGDGVIAMPP